MGWDGMGWFGLNGSFHQPLRSSRGSWSLRVAMTVDSFLACRAFIEGRQVTDRTLTFAYDSELSPKKNKASPLSFTKLVPTKRETAVERLVTRRLLSSCRNTCFSRSDSSPQPHHPSSCPPAFLVPRPPLSHRPVCVCWRCFSCSLPMCAFNRVSVGFHGGLRA